MQAVEGIEKVVPPPAQKQTASAPPTPQHPEGTPRALSPSEEFPLPPGRPMTDAWLPGGASSPAVRRDDSVTAEQDELPGVPMDLAATLPAVLPGVPQSPAQSYDYAPALRNAASPSGTAGSPAPPPAPGPAPQAPQPVVDSDLQPVTRTSKPTPSAGASDECLDLPLEEVLKQATEAFGQIACALSSTKWDRRVQALKGITTVLKGLDIKTGLGSLAAEGNTGGARGLQLRDHARCFNAACLILHIVMREKVLPVLLAAHELYKVTFEHGRAAVTEAHALRAADELFPHILAKLGDLNIRLHESACSCVLFTAMQPFFGITVVLARLFDVVDGRGVQQTSTLRGQQKMRVHYGVLQAVEMLLKQSPGRREDEGDVADAVATWSPADIAPFIVVGLHADSVTGARVQQGALGLAMNVYTTLGKSALLPILAELSSAAKDILAARLEEEGEDIEDLEGDDPDEECIEFSGDLCVLGVGLQPQLSIAKANTTDGEECLMDEILEDTGLVFDGQALGKKQAPLRSVLDEELKGLDLNNFDEDDLDQLDTATSMGSGNVRRLRSKEGLLS